MLNLKQLTIRNFMSFGNVPAVFNLAEKQSLMIIGDNKDVGEQGVSRNGVGKTTAIQAIIFAIYGEGIDKIKSDEFINIVNQKEMMVELEFEIKGTDYKIRRGRKPNTVEFLNLTTGVSLTRDSMKNTDDLIQQTVGMPYEIFVGVFFMSPHKESFMAMGAASQRAFIENILSLNVLAERAETLKAMRSDMNVLVRIEEEKLASGIQQNNKITDRLAELNRSFDEFEIHRKQRLESMSDELKSLESLDYENIIENIEQIESLHAKNLESTQKINEIERLINSLRTDIERKKSDIVGAKKIQASCEQFSLEPQKKRFDEIEKELSERLSVEELTAAIDKQRQLSEESAKYAAELKLIEHQQNTVARKIQTDANRVEEIKEEIRVLSSGTCPYCKQSHTDHEKMDSLVKALKALTESIEFDEAEYTKLETDLENLENVISEAATEIIPIIELDAELKDVQRMIKEKEQLRVQLDQPNPYQVLASSLFSDHSVDGFDAYFSLLENNVSVSERELEHLTTNLDEHRAVIDNNLLKIDNLRKNNGNFVRVIDVERVLDKIDRLKVDIETLEQSKNIYEDQIAEVSKLQVDLSSIESELEVLTKKQTHIGYLIKLLTDSKSFVRKNIVDQYIPLLNKNINTYAAELGLTHVTTINADLSVDIAYLQRPVSYYNLSQGERMRLNLATTAAFRDLMALLGKNCNMIFCDELFDSALDSSGMLKAFNFTKNRANHVWLISHREELYPHVDRIMTITKSNGFSTVELK